MTEDELRIIGTREAADLLGWSQRKVQRKADTGQIPVIRKKIGERREYIFDADAIAALAERSH